MHKWVCDFAHGLGMQHEFEQRIQDAVLEREKYVGYLEILQQHCEGNENVKRLCSELEATLIPKESENLLLKQNVELQRRVGALLLSTQ